MLESALEDLFRRAARRASGIPVKVVAVDAGVPDRYVLWPGGNVELVELKTDKGRLRPAQVEWHRRAAAIGHHITVLHGSAEIRAWGAERTP
jgi:hypothetical protein